MYKINKSSWFTLVELIVVVTILWILSTIWFVAYSWYLVWVRDTNRISQLKSISDWLELYRTKYSLPLPDDYVEIKASWSIVWYQWYAWKHVLESIAYTSEWVDPKDKTYFSFYLTKDKKYYQLMAFLEEGKGLQWDTDLQTYWTVILSKANALNYSTRYPTVYWKALWILTDEDNTPIQEDSSIKSAWYLDIVNTTNTYIARLKDNEPIVKWTWSLLVSTLPNASCKRIKQINWRSQNWVYTINPTWISWFKAFCEMDIDGGGRLLVMRDFSDNRISSSKDSIKNPFSASAASLWNISDKTAKYKLDTSELWLNNTELLFKWWNIWENVENYIDAWKFNYVIIKKSLKDFGWTDKDNCNNYTMDDNDCETKEITPIYDSRWGDLILKNYWFWDTDTAPNFCPQRNVYNKIWMTVKTNWNLPKECWTNPTTIKREMFIR